MNLNNIAVLNIKGSDYCCIITRISKNEIISFMQNVDLIGRNGALKNRKIYYPIRKISKEILAFGDIEIEENVLYCHKNPIF